MLTSGEEEEAVLISRWFLTAALAREGSGHSARCRVMSESLQLQPASSERRKLG